MVFSEDHDRLLNHPAPCFLQNLYQTLLMTPSQSVNWKITALYSAGERAVDPNDPDKVNTLNQLSKTEISLYLTSKYDIGDGEAIDGQSLMIK